MSTTPPDTEIGGYCLPMTMREFVFQLSHGNPCQIPTFWLGRAMQAMDLYFSNADIAVYCKKREVIITPNRAELSEAGHKFLHGS